MYPRHVWPMLTTTKERQPSFQAYTARNLYQMPQFCGLSGEELLAMRALTAVLPFGISSYVVEPLIDWDDLECDPIYRLTFPSPGMLHLDDLPRMVKLLREGASAAIVAAEAHDIQRRFNPHSSGQFTLNVPMGEDQRLGGLRHNYHETVLFFPGAGQTCHAFCTYCFRWAQFVGEPGLKLSCNDPRVLCDYLRQHPGVTDVLITGGDPMVTQTDILARFLVPLLAIGSVRTIRTDTKAAAYWPYRFLSHADANDLSRLFERVIYSGRQLAIMAHYSHPRESAPGSAREAVLRIRTTGTSVYVQAPLIQRINDRADIWVKLWRTALDLGGIPYYIFVDRDTGPREFFEVPLVNCGSIFREAYSQVSGLGRTVHGPVMSATPGRSPSVESPTSQAPRRSCSTASRLGNLSWLVDRSSQGLMPRRPGSTSCTRSSTATVISSIRRGEPRGQRRVGECCWGRTRAVRMGRSQVQTSSRIVKPSCSRRIRSAKNPAGGLAQGWRR